MGQIFSFLSSPHIFEVTDKTMFWKLLCGLLLAKYGISFVYFLLNIMKLYVLPKFGMRTNLKKYGSWAVVTGATDGIGKAVAKKLAKRGLNLVLISRSEDKLASVREELSKDSKIEIKTISYDFNNTDGYGKIEEQLNSIDIGLLVNNVGMSYDHPDEYMAFDEKLHDSLINLNITSVMKMTRIVLKGMEERKRGLLIHISSASSLSPTPYLTTYGAAKAFVNSFGEALDYEYADKGIQSQVVYPYFVATNMSRLRAGGLLIPSADSYAGQMVNAIGLSTRMTGYWSHEILVQLISLFPRFLVMHYLVNMLREIRKRWLKKQQQKKD